VVEINRPDELAASVNAGENDWLKKHPSTGGELRIEVDLGDERIQIACGTTCGHAAQPLSTTNA
jgi:hypothetical protein